MSRSLKPYSVETMFDSKTRSRVEVMFDRDDKVFFAVVQLKRLQAASVEALRAMVTKAFAGLAPVKWDRVIELRVSKESDWGGRSDKIEEHKAELNVSFKRFEIGVTAAGTNLKRPFAEDVNDVLGERLAEDPLYCCSTDYDRDKEGRRIPYNEAVWTALQNVKATIDAAYEKLEPMFNPEDKGAKLIALGMPAMPLLPANAEVVDGEAPTIAEKLVDGRYTSARAQADDARKLASSVLGKKRGR